MATDVFSVQTDMDQEEVAKIVARYDILPVPVVDNSNRLVGIVTVDDVIDIFRREATEDILKMAGAGEEFVETKSVLKSTRIRLPWLFASCLGGIIAFFIIGKFEGSLNKITALAAFIPVIMGMGGNIGTQSSTIVVRGLATGRIVIRDLWPVVFKELSIGVILGLVYATAWKRWRWRFALQLSAPCLSPRWSARWSQCVLPASILILLLQQGLL
jgi:magnesium transporter